MPAIKTRSPGSSHLLTRLLATQDLVRAVQALPAERLGALVHEVGLEDAGELVALATTEQLEQLFDDDLWSSGDGLEEQFSPERFGLWLEVLFEAGEAAVVRRLLALSREFVAFAVAQMAFVVDLDALQADVSLGEEELEEAEHALEQCASEEWEEFRLMDRGAGGFDVLVQALLALDREHSGELRAILERACALTLVAAEEHGGLLPALSLIEESAGDQRAERDQRRTARGYVNLADARSFLRLCHEGLDYSGGRDPITHAYFREVEGPRAAADAQRQAKAQRPSKVLFALGAEAENQGSVLVGASPQRTLREAMQQLFQTAPARYDQRLKELSYLSNVLVEATRATGRPLRPIEAADLVLEVCQLGLNPKAGLTTQAPPIDLEHQLLDLAFRAGFQTARIELETDPYFELILRAVGGNTVA